MKKPGASFLLPPPETALPAALGFLRQARYLLAEVYRFKLKGALAQLTEEQLWWRPDEASNSVGNLSLHLCGNARQWVIAGLGGAADQRDRPTEFSARETCKKDELLKLLDATLNEVDSVLAQIENELSESGTDEAVQREYAVQGFRQTGLDAIFHVVEHFSYHTGQIVYLAKWQTDGSVRFYNDHKLMGKSGQTAID